MNAALFYVFAALALLGALGMVLNVRNTVASALSLVGTMVALGAIYVQLEAYLVGVLQILVYAGAIVVVFLFVVMLLNLRRDEFAPPRLRRLQWLAVGLGALSAGWFVGVLQAGLPAPSALPEGFGGYRSVGAELYTDWVLAFEVTGLLLLSAMVGAVVLAKRKLD